MGSGSEPAEIYTALRSRALNATPADLASSYLRNCGCSKRSDQDDPAGAKSLALRS